jgi:RNA polymerase sigma-70 factor, ECF subfamily
MTALAIDLSSPALMLVSSAVHSAPRKVTKTREALSTVADKQLAEDARSGDMDAFEELVVRHRDKVYARAFSMLQNEDEALELAQEAWVKSWQKLSLFQGKSSFATWITRIVINLCLDQLRRRQHQRAESLEQLNEEAGGFSRQLPVVVVNPTERLEREELRETINAALGQLSPEHRTVLVLHAFEDMAYKDIAGKLGCSIGTVMSRLFYARRKLAAFLSGMGAAEAI